MNAQCSFDRPIMQMQRFSTMDATLARIESKFLVYDEKIALLEQAVFGGVPGADCEKGFPTEKREKDPKTGSAFSIRLVTGVRMGWRPHFSNSAVEPLSGWHNGLSWLARSAHC